MKRALITGVTGQDGAYLARFLLDKGYEVYGTYRRLSSPNFWRLEYLGVFDRVNFLPVELSDVGSIVEALKISEPDEVYHLAAQSFVEASFEAPVATGDITGLATTRILEAIRQVCPDVKFYNAATSEMFGKAGLLNGGKPLNENDVFMPMSPYAAAKLYGYWITRIYREGYKIFAVNGILFNHESPLRGLEFVTRKIANEVAKIKLGLSRELRLGNLDAKRDWGYAPEYVESMWLMLQQDEPDDYVIATGEAHSVREFAEKAFDIVGLNWKDYVRVDKRFMRPLDVPCLVGDYSKAERKLGWKPRVKFDKLVEIMVREEVDRWSRWLKGERFPWDAPNYPSENKILTRALRM
ncbi:MAG: GDP-mannose 4,6-dehydratase [Candidatus Verstraetearchaeota archaeon]|nr:GDP-mannose 4,6-dehydratase [Candidatus Verstraetearchaeota archaeon]